MEVIMSTKIHFSLADLAAISARIANSPVDAHGVSVLADGPISPIGAKIIRQAGGFSRERLNEAFRIARAAVSDRD
jgi:hypothetical protein